MAEPNPDDPLNGEIASIYEEDRAEHDKLAREHTIKYAKKDLKAEKDQRVEKDQKVEKEAT